jgi:hypothetical protein
MSSKKEMCLAKVEVMDVSASIFTTNMYIYLLPVY